MKTERIQKFLQIFIAVAMGLIPLVWSTRVNANYYTTKTFLLYFVAGICGVYLFVFKNKETAFFSRSLHNILVVVSLAQIILLLQSPWPEGLFYIAKFLSLIALIYYLKAIRFQLSDFISKYEVFLVLFLAVLIGITGYNLYQISISEGPFVSANLYKPFGNVNMLAEFYIFALPFIYFWLCARGDDRTPVGIHRKALDIYRKILQWFFFLSINIFILCSQSRSAYLGLGLWWVWWSYERFLKSHSRSVKLGVMAALAILVSVTLVPRLNTYFATKSGSTNERSNFYQSAVDLIKAHPGGISHGYLNSIVPYRLSYPFGPNEYDFPDQPHSEILKWGVQFGWLGLFTSLSCLALFAFRIFSSESFLLQGLFIVILPQLLFQFPFENPASVFILSIAVYLTGQKLDLLPILGHKMWSFVYLSRLVALLSAVVLFFVSYAFFKSIYLESNYPNDVEKTVEACKLNPTNLRACARKNYNLLASGEYPRLIQSLKDDTEFNYYAVDYLKILSQLVQVKKQSSLLEKPCQITQVYAFIYKSQSYFSQEDLELCKTVAMPVPYVDPQQFDRDYKTWYQKLLNDLDQELK